MKYGTDPSVYVEAFVRQVQSTFQNGKMDEEVYRDLMGDICLSSDRGEILDHYERLFTRLRDHHIEQLQRRIIQGAEFIEQLDMTDPRYQPAMRKYDQLCAQWTRAIDRKER